MQYSSDIKKSLSDYLISINSCGELRVTTDSHIRRYAGRNDYQLIYICEGQCVVTRNGLVQVAYPGDCVLYRPGEVQDYLLPKKAQTHTYWIHFAGTVCHKLLETLALEDVSIIRTKQNREIEYMIARVCRYYNLKVPHREMLCSGLMQSVLTLLSNEVYRQPHPSEGKGGDKISELISRIKMVPGLNITVTECAEFCNMSKSHFARVFKHTTGMPPVQFMLELRMERAKELLDFTEKPIAEVAEASGFRDQNYFTRTFKKATGMSPSQYRNATQTRGS